MVQVLLKVDALLVQDWLIQTSYQEAQTTTASTLVSMEMAN